MSRYDYITQKDQTPKPQPSIQRQEVQVEVVPEVQSLEKPSQTALDVLDQQWGDLQNILTKGYLQTLSTAQVVPYEQEYPKHKQRGTRWYQIDRIVYEDGIFFGDKFAMLLNALHTEAREVLLYLHRQDGGKIQLFLGASDISDENNYYAGETLKSSLDGIFPGINTNLGSPANIMDFTGKAISSVSAVASLHDDKKEEFIQGLERLINATASIRNFGVLIIAERVGEHERRQIVQGYEQMHTMLSPLASTQVTYSTNQSISLTKGESESLSKTLTEGVSRTITHGSNTSESQTETTGTSTTITETNTTGGSLNLGYCGGSHSYSSGESNGISNSHSSGVTQGTSKSTSEGKSESTSRGTTNSTNSSESRTQGTGESYMVTHENKSVRHLLDQIDKQIERLDERAALGLWNCATYIIANDNTTSHKLSNIYKGCIIGEESEAEVTAINLWRANSPATNEISTYLKHFVHPRFNIGSGKHNVSAGSLVSSKELAIHLSLPQSSVPGVLVQHRVPFGREVHVMKTLDPQNIEKGNNKKESSNLQLGRIYHLGVVEPTPVVLDKSAFTKHIFVTGSTGSGKSNTVYHLLDKLMHPSKPEETPIKVLIIEPAKGEYKHVLKDAHVYGSNPNLSDLLRINPFAFPKEIRVDEHVDRLIEIFNACWPMYAAMPAILKDAVLRSYKACGWDMDLSTSEYGLFPTFEDVLQQLNEVVRSSAYSANTQGDYIGALETRLRTLSNGLFAQIFSNSNCIPDSDLFDEHVVIDLSRIGASETKALIMGVLMLKLSEYRMATANGKMNQPLKHITVLEEAHNLLKRTSKEQSQEGSNVQGKSVEMIANAIAEMRTYGEAFMIVDQSPTALDESAIKNTNTKIIMSLPDGDDRRIAGKAVGLSDEQVDEISRLPVGVGIVFQNNWDEAVMCKIDRYEEDETPFTYTPTYSTIHESQLQLILTLLLKGRGTSDFYIDIEQTEEAIHRLHQSTSTKVTLLNALKEYKQFGEIRLWKDNNFELLSKLVTDLLGVRDEVQRLSEQVQESINLTNQLTDLVLRQTQLLHEDLHLSAVQCLMRDYSLQGEMQTRTYDVWYTEQFKK